MKKITAFALKTISDPYEPPETHAIYESLNLIEKENVVIHVRVATDHDRSIFSQYTEEVYKDIKTNEEIGVDWAGPKGYFVEEIDLYLNN